MHTLLSPRTVGSCTGISGIVDLAPGERVDEHYHPYSEEHHVLVGGTVQVDIDGRPARLEEGSAVLLPRHVRHRVTNVGAGPARLVFALSPLAPRPELGHVDTETQPAPAVAAFRPEHA
jgi:quercetin dioxygenase-like cupin family protein